MGTFEGRVDDTFSLSLMVEGRVLEVTVLCGMRKQHLIAVKGYSYLPSSSASIETIVLEAAAVRALAAGA